MPRKRYTPEEIVAKLRQVEVLTSQSSSIAEGAKAIGVTEATYLAGFIFAMPGYDPCFQPINLCAERL